jgi:GrpB-like predicted nucleotidyltransferase (UPF0157 family)
MWEERMKKYLFREYSNKYPKLFEKERKKLITLIPNLKIEHIGSTAIEGLGGKGIIDVMISVPKKEIDEIKNRLIKAKYNFKSEAGDKNRFFFEKDYGLIKKRRVHLQLTSNNSDVWKKAIKFRDILRKNKKIRNRYSLIKQEAVLLRKKNKDYRNFKKKFIERVLK